MQRPSAGQGLLRPEDGVPSPDRPAARKFASNERDVCSPTELLEQRTPVVSFAEVQGRPGKTLVSGKAHGALSAVAREDVLPRPQM